MADLIDFSPAERTFSPTSRPKGFAFAGFTAGSYRDLFVALVSSQLKVRYREAVLGIGWALLNPLLLMFVYAYIFGAVFGVDRGLYRLFLLVGLMPWQAFNAAISASLRALVNGSDLLRKVPFPSELLTVATVATAMVNFGIVFALLLVYLGIDGFPVITALPWILIALMIEISFAIGLALLLGALNVLFRDVEQIMSFILTLWFFLTPILYPLSRLTPGQAKLVVFANPMAAVVTTMQDAILRGRVPELEPLFAAAAISLAVLVVGWKVFGRLKHEFPKVA